jgi:hypothetical protein
VGKRLQIAVLKQDVDRSIPEEVIKKGIKGSPTKRGTCQETERNDIFVKVELLARGP